MRESCTLPVGTVCRVASTNVSEVSECYTEVSRGEMKKMFTTRCPQPTFVAKRDAFWGTTGNLIVAIRARCVGMADTLSVFKINSSSLEFGVMKIMQKCS